MKPLVDFNLALEKVDPTSTDSTVSKTIGESPKPFAQFKLSHLSTALNILAVTVAVGGLELASQASILVQQGDRGSEVAALQERLRELGYFKANVTGYYGGITKEAVRQFQQARGLTPDGVVGGQTQAALEEQSEEETAKDSADSESVLQVGDRGEQVDAVQKRLAYAGYFGGERGIFDEETQDAVRKFQQAKGLAVDGIVGPKTLSALPEIGESKPTPAPKQKPILDEDKPIIKDSEPTPKSEQAPQWYEDNSAPLQPFIR